MTREERLRARRVGQWFRRALRVWGLWDLGWRWAWLDPDDHADVDEVARGYGLCDFDTKMLYIEQGHALLDDWREVVDTCAHEVAHALSGDSSHGPRFKKAFRALAHRHRLD